MNLINDDKANKVSIAGTGTLANDDVPFSCCGDDNLRLGDLLLSRLRITSELAGFDTKRVWKWPTISCTRAFIGAM